jgi:hypothetical protein
METFQTNLLAPLLNHLLKVGLSGAGGDAPAPGLAYLATAFTWSVPKWAWATSMPVFGLDLELDGLPCDSFF